MKDKILKLCRRLKKCTLDDLVSLTETDEDIVKTALLYLENEGFIQINNGQISCVEQKKYTKGKIETKKLDLMFEYRTPEEIEIIVKGFCLEIPPQKLCVLIGVKHCVGYRGGNVVERPEKLADEIKSGKILPFENFKKVFDDFIINVLNKRPSQGKNLKGSCPDELFNQEFTEKITTSKDGLKLFCMRTSRNFTVGRTVIVSSSTNAE